MKEYICPPCISFTLDNFIRKKIHDPDKMLADLIKPGYTVLDLGCGPGYFTIPMARMAGASGKVIAADIQEKMLAKVRKKAVRHKMTDRIIPVQCQPDSINVHEKVDFVLTFWMVHEVSDKKNFFTQIAAVMKKKSKFLLVEPKLHVTLREYQEIIRIAESAGLKSSETAPVALSRSTLFKIR